MKLDVRFSENDMSIDVALPNEPKSFNPNMGEFVVVHDGQNGATFTPFVSDDGVLSWTNDRELDNPKPVNIKGKDGKNGVDGYTPVKGKDYFDGKNGVDGKDGYTPIKGVDYFDGKDGKNGVDGKDGYTPVKGKDYFDGSPGKNGADGQPGKDGTDGYTPVRGKDYWTDADKAEMVSSVIAALPVYDGSVVSV